MVSNMKTEQMDLGMIACPGAEYFTHQIVNRMEQYSNLFNTDSGAAIKAEDYLIPVHFSCFANGEIKSEILTSIRHKDVYIVADVENHYPLIFPGRSEEIVLSVNDHIMSLFVTIDAARKSGAGRISLVLPTFPYSRQHKKTGREGLTAALFSQIVESMGVRRIITLDIHCSEIENSFNRMSLENLHGSYQILKSFVHHVDVEKEDLVIVSPDTGAVERNKYYANNLQKPLGILYKERNYSLISEDAGTSNIRGINLLGDVQNKTVLMTDDLLGTGGTLIKAMEALKEFGAGKIYCGISLPLFTGKAVEHFEQAYRNNLFEKIIATNSVYHENDLLNREWYVNADISKLFAEVLYTISTGGSISNLLNDSQPIQKLLSRE